MASSSASISAVRRSNPPPTSVFRCRAGRAARLRVFIRPVLVRGCHRTMTRRRLTGALPISHAPQQAVEGTIEIDGISRAQRPVHLYRDGQDIAPNDLGRAVPAGPHRTQTLEKKIERA